ncbi:protein prenyltransferase alpha subunit repeat-containing protein 1 [Halichoeres trimaculatus]|uniref:protein prenyltransferase alpha subunit repeat-containing protein 1 n=1 Tax=Halichoeres trimaculatus TaxID=147232 RepID=UPI003D9EE994
MKMAECEEEEEVLVQRVVKDITNAFKRNPSIDEIGVIPCPEARYNRSPIVLVENKLGLESWCVKFLLPYVHNKLLLYRQRKYWLDREALVDITCTVLLLNPDFTTAWNVRKELLQSGVLNPEKDLYLGQLALTKFPKSPETWIHRRWVLKQVLGQSWAGGRLRKQQRQGGEVEQVDVDERQQLNDHLARTLHQEMKVCSDAACRYPSNYNAWSHRIWVLQHMASGNIKVYHDELSSMRLWVSMHVSDHSGFHYRQFLLKELVSELSQSAASNTSSPQHRSSPAPSSPPLCLHSHANGELSGGEGGEDEEERQLNFITVLQLFHQEMELISDLIQCFPGHEALWSHRRHVFFLWQQWRRDQRLHGGDGESVVLSDEEAGLQKGETGSCAGRGEECVNGQSHSEAMEVEGASVPDPRGSKRLKRGVHLPAPSSLPSEYAFVRAVLDSCCPPEQRRFALSYRKWLDTVMVQKP